MKDPATQVKRNYALEKLCRLNILLVEDNLLNAKLVSILFLEIGMKLQVAKNGMEAIEKIKTNRFDMVLMDMEMPVMNGYQATAIIRQQLKNNIPIIALTAHSLPGEMEKCLQLGMNDYITKPINADLLFNSIYKLTCLGKTGLRKTGNGKLPGLNISADKVCNLGYLVGVTRGNKKIINNIVSVFFKETTKELCSLDDAIKKTNYTVISNISHKIRSAFSILGISVLDPVFKEMELLSSSTSPIGKIEILNDRINMVFNQAMAEMKVSC
jgi:CheY-like chemotaxis protein